MGAHEGLAALKVDRARRRARWSPWPWLALAVLLGLGALAAPRVLKHFNVPEVSVAAAVKAGADGRAAAPELSAAGYVVADCQSTLAAKVTGRLVLLNVWESKIVKKDDLIAEVDHRELDAHVKLVEAEKGEAAEEVQRLRSAVAQAEAEVAAARAPLDTFDAELKEHRIRAADARRRWDRDSKLVEQEAMAASEQEDRLTEVKAMEARIETTLKRRVEVERKIAVAEALAAVARCAVPVAEARVSTVARRLDVLTEQLKDYRVHAPFDGKVTEKMAEVGEIVAPISVGGAMARGSIVTIAAWDSLQAEVDIAESYIARVKERGRAAISVDAFPGRVFPGRVLRILPRANRSKATVQVRVEFLEREKYESGELGAKGEKGGGQEAVRILPEMGIRVKFLPEDAPAGAERGEAKDKIVVPRQAVHGPPGETHVWIVVDEVARKRPVVCGAEIEGNVEITSGLAAGEVVVTSSTEKLEDNRKVRVKKGS